MRGEGYFTGNCATHLRVSISNGRWGQSLGESIADSSLEDDRHILSPQIDFPALHR
jgi:hypothetical protein